MKKIFALTILVLFFSAGIACAKIKVYPNPWVPSDKSGRQSKLFVQFENLPSSGGKIQIYNVAGQLVSTVKWLPGTTTAEWYGKNNTSEPVASGVYTWVVKDGGTKDGKIVVIK